MADTCDAVILAGGRASAEMAARAGTPLRALFPYRDRPFVQWVFEALRASVHIGRIAVIGPPELAQTPGVEEADLVLRERDTIVANLFAALEALAPNGRVLITACDNPLLTTAVFDDFLARAPREAAVAYPILRHDAFLERFPQAGNIPVVLRDGAWIGGDCILLQSDAIPRLRHAIEAVLNARKSKARMFRLLGPRFALRLALKRAHYQEVERRASEIVGLPVRFVLRGDPVFAIDIDDPEDWDYLQGWSEDEGVKG